MNMCGIFGYVAYEDIDFKSAVRGLWAIEEDQSIEPHGLSIGKSGAGLLIYWGDKWLLRQARAIGSPCVNIAVKLEEEFGELTQLYSNIYIGHVRGVYDEYWWDTLKYFEYLQPYIVSCNPNVKVISSHAGNVTNLSEIRSELSSEHRLATEEKGKICGSEVLAHYFDMLVNAYGVDKALDILFDKVEGNNTAAFMVIGKDVKLAFMHKGATEGFVLWENGKGGIVYASRYSSVMSKIGDLLTKLGFEKKVEIRPGEHGEFKKVYEIPEKFFKRGKPSEVVFVGY